MRLKRGRIAVDSDSAARGPGSPGKRHGSALSAAQRELTPTRCLAVVALAAAFCLGGSQFADYRAVEVGTLDYGSIENSVPAPQLDQRSPRSAHGSWVLAIAGVSVIVIALAVVRKWRLARLLALLGAAVIAISLLVDAREGLREGVVGVSYQGAKAVLLGGFWVQLSAGVTLMVVGPLLAVHLRGERRARRSRPPGRRARTDDATGSPTAPAGRSGIEGAAT